MNIPVFKFVDGKLVEVHGFKEWPASIREAIPKQVKPEARAGYAHSSRIDARTHERANREGRPSESQSVRPNIDGR